MGSQIMSFPFNIYRQLQSHIEKRLPKRKVFFLHIPKCGGSSIDRAISAHYKSPMRITSDAIFRLNASASLKASQVCGLTLADYREHLLMYYLSQKQIRYITGHFVFKTAVFSEFIPDWDFITVLRHPVSRWFSHYFFNRHKTSDHFSTDLDLQAYMKSERGISQGHFLVYYLTGQGAGLQSVLGSTVAEAIENLDKFAIAGCLEHLDVFKRQFEKRYGVKLNISRKNVNPLAKTHQKDQITEEIRRKVENICRPDLDVYNYLLSTVLRES